MFKNGQLLQSFA